MCENAKEYNEPKSQIYKDAIILRKTVDEFVETEPEKPMPILTSNGDGRRMAAVRRTGSTVAAPEAVPSRKMEAAMMSIVDDLLSITDEAYV